MKKFLQQIKQSILKPDLLNQQISAASMQISANGGAKRLSASRSLTDSKQSNSSFMKTKPKKVVKKSTPKKAVSKKVTAKKPSVKKTATKSTPQKSLVFAPEQQSFWVNDGQILNSLVSLHDALEQMEKAVYEYHVNNDRNDFADWVNSVLCDEQCALDLRKAKTPKTAKTKIAKHLKVYQI